MGLTASAQTLIEKALIRLGVVKKGGGDLGEWFGWGGGLPGGSRLTNQRQYLGAYLDWVYAATSTNAKDAASIDFRAYVNRTSTKSSKIAKRIMDPRQLREMLQRSGDKSALEELDNHILLDLLENPNPFMDGQTFHELTFLHLQLAGEAFWGKVRNGLGKPEQLWPMVPYNMKEVPGNGPDDFIKGWLYRVNGKDYAWPVEDVVHIKLPDPNNFRRGMSIVKAAARAIETDTHAADWNRNFFRNSARPDFVLQTDATLTDETFKRLKAQWDDMHAGTDNAHKAAILEAGLKANTLTMSQKDMDFLESRKFSRDQILAMTGVSRVMLGLIEGDGRANMEAAEYNHAKRTIRPLMARAVSAVNHSLAPEYDPKLVIGFSDPVPEDKEFDHKVRMESVNKTHTINEIRAEMGDDPIEGGDVLYQPLNLVPLGTPLEQPTEQPDDEIKNALIKLAEAQEKLAEEVRQQRSEGEQSLGKRWLSTQTQMSGRR
jgi:HK97 family phage portal protein